jgi:hypothetical protein
MADLVDAREYKFGHAPMSPPWDDRMITFAVDQDTSEKFVGVGFICEIVGLDIDTQTRMLRRASETTVTSDDEARFALEPSALRKIHLPPRDDAKARAGMREQVCILYSEVGWWLSHVPPFKIKDERIRAHVDQFQRAVKDAADRLWWHGSLGTARVLPAPRELLTTSSCQHDINCPWCKKWARVSTRNGETEIERLA